MSFLLKNLIQIRKQASATLLVLMLLALSPSEARAEYRAYLLEVYDIVEKVTWETPTGMPPDLYLSTHGGRGRIRVLMKATWMCYGNTSQYDYVCEMPTPRFPKLLIGDSVRVVLDKHVTKDWQGTVEVALWREDLQSNVYGVRFIDRGSLLYARYFERDLEKLQTAADQQGASSLTPQSPGQPASSENNTETPTQQ